jgi:hypothetical protein
MNYDNPVFSKSKEKSIKQFSSASLFTYDCGCEYYFAFLEIKWWNLCKKHVKYLRGMKTYEEMQLINEMGSNTEEEELSKEEIEKKNNKEKDKEQEKPKEEPEYNPDEDDND